MTSRWIAREMAHYPEGAERTIAGWLAHEWRVASDPWCPDDYVHPLDTPDGPVLVCSPVAMARASRTALAVFDLLARRPYPV